MIVILVLVLTQLMIRIGIKLLVFAQEQAYLFTLMESYDKHRQGLQLGTFRTMVSYVLDQIEMMVMKMIRM